MVAVSYNCNLIDGLQNTTTLFRGYIPWLSRKAQSADRIWLAAQTIVLAGRLMTFILAQATLNIKRITGVWNSTAKTNTLKTSGLHPTICNSLRLHGIPSTSTKTPAKFCLAATSKPHTTPMILWDNHRGRNSGPCFVYTDFWYLHINLLY